MDGEGKGKDEGKGEDENKDEDEGKDEDEDVVGEKVDPMQNSFGVWIC